MLQNNQQKLILIQDLGMIFPTETSKDKKRYGIFRCYCGAEFKTHTQSVKRGLTQSCGCIKTTHGMTNHRLYPIWKAMLRRCTNPKSTNFKNYGGRNISVCDRWLDVANFIADMHPSFIEGLSIDRIDNDKGYSLENCRWSTREVQSRNTRLIRSTNTSGYRGIYFHKQTNKWLARIKVNGKIKHLGLYITALQSARAYDIYITSNMLEHTINGVL